MCVLLFMLSFFSLLKQIAHFLNPANPEFTLRALKTLKKIVDKYEYSSRSDPLYEEIILVCDTTHDLLLTTFQVLFI